jgi:hypothetical protein
MVLLKALNEWTSHHIDELETREQRAAVVSKVNADKRHMLEMYIDQTGRMLEDIDALEDAMAKEPDE